MLFKNFIFSPSFVYLCYNSSMKVKTTNIEDTKKLAEIFAECLSPAGAFVSLFGDIGAGKTAFASFVILNEYKGAKFPIYHFDLYRLENEGLETIKEELREYSKAGILTFVEWADFGTGELPYNRLNIKVSYNEDFDDTRFYEFEPVGAEYEEFVQKLAQKARGKGLLI